MDVISPGGKFVEDKMNGYGLEVLTGRFSKYKKDIYLYDSILIDLKKQFKNNTRHEILGKYSSSLFTKYIEELKKESVEEEFLFWDTKYMLNGFYIGQMNVNRQPHGKGLLIFNNLDKGVYIGEWKANFRDGIGKHYINNKLHYEGEYYLNERRGKGKYYFMNNITLDGVFNEKGNGNGVFESIEIRYEGEISYYLPNGDMPLVNSKGDKVNMISLIEQVNGFRLNNEYKLKLQDMKAQTKIIADFVSKFNKDLQNGDVFENIYSNSNMVCVDLNLEEMFNLDINIEMEDEINIEETEDAKENRMFNVIRSKQTSVENPPRTIIPKENITFGNNAPQSTTVIISNSPPDNNNNNRKVQGRPFIDTPIEKPSKEFPTRNITESKSPKSTCNCNIF